jgi:hypothetical protein
VVGGITRLHNDNTRGMQFASIETHSGKIADEAALLDGAMP